MNGGFADNESAYWFHRDQQAYFDAIEKMRPCYLLRPKLFIEGDKWCALYGDNLQDGVAGFGDSPELAYLDFDKQWSKKLPAGAQ
jgi:hypothetical protein